MAASDNVKRWVVPADLGKGTTLGGLEIEAGEDLASQFSVMEPWLRYGTTADVLRGFITQEEPEVVRCALWQDGELAGFAVIRLNWLRGPYLQFLGVLGKFQSGGIGQRFLDWLEREAAVAGYRHVWIMVSEFNARARAFYQRQGYEEIAAVPDVIKDGFCEILLRKRV